MVCCGVSRGKVVGHHFFENENVNSENYRNMLIHYAFSHFASLTEDYIFQQAGSPAHYYSRVWCYLNKRRPGKWIERGGQVEWPPHSPNFTHCDFSAGNFKRKGVCYSDRHY